MRLLVLLVPRRWLRTPHTHSSIRGNKYVGRQLVPFLAFPFVLLLLLSGGYWAVTGSITFFFLCSLKNRLFFGGGGVIKRVKLLRQSSVPCYEM